MRRIKAKGAGQEKGEPSYSNSSLNCEERGEIRMVASALGYSTVLQMLRSIQAKVFHLRNFTMCVSGL